MQILKGGVEMNYRKFSIGVMTVAIVLALCMPSFGASSDKVFKWRAQTYASAGSLGFRAFEEALKTLKAVTDGRLDITLYGAGTLVGSFEQIDALGKGIFEVGHNAPAYYAGKDAAFSAIFSMAGVWPNSTEAKVWVDYFGGKELAKELYAKYNIHYVGRALSAPEPIMSKKPLKSLEDFKGLKIRTTPGLASMLFQKLGASPVPLPAGEIYTALDTGVVDAAEFVTISENWDIGLHEVSKYVLYPSFHCPTAICDISVNADTWKKLPPDLQAAMEMVIYEVDARWDYMGRAESIDRLTKMLEKGLVLTTLSDADMKKARGFALENAIEWKKKSPMADKMISSEMDYLKKAGYVE
jgi:TRAP-type mannitol/chloroaromatic compound transport system substrate-binding protein